MMRLVNNAVMDNNAVVVGAAKVKVAARMGIPAQLLRDAAEFDAKLVSATERILANARHRDLDFRWSEAGCGEYSGVAIHEYRCVDDIHIVDSTHALYELCDIMEDEDTATEELLRELKNEETRLRKRWAAVLPDGETYVHRMSKKERKTLWRILPAWVYYCVSTPNGRVCNSY